jgi:hypothetical protein
MISSPILVCCTGLILVFCTGLALSQAAAPPRSAAGYNDRIPIRNVQALTLRKGYFTTGRRLAPVPQLKRVGGNAQTSYEPNVVQCKNVGYDGLSVQWDCTAEMKKRYKFGSIRIVCEGYEHSKDTDVLVGSCGLEYGLDYASGYGKNKNKHRRPAASSSTTTTSYTTTHAPAPPSSSYEVHSYSWGEGLMWVGFISLILVALLIVSCCTGKRRAVLVHQQPTAASASTSYVYPDHQPDTTSSYVSGLATGYSLGSTNAYQRPNVVYQPPTTYSTTTTTTTTNGGKDEDDDDGDRGGDAERDAHGYGGTDTR